MIKSTVIFKTMAMARSILGSVFYTSLLLPTLSYALPSDRYQPIHIEADEAEINEADGSSVYRGNVTFDQGTMRLSADQILIITVDSEIIKIVASTNDISQTVAHYEQQPESGEAIVYADARKITYYALEERLSMIGQAILQQTETRFSGELLTYSVKEGTVSLIGSTDAAAGKSDRVDILWSPQKR